MVLDISVVIIDGCLQNHHGVTDIKSTYNNTPRMADQSFTIDDEAEPWQPTLPPSAKCPIGCIFVFRRPIFASDRLVNVFSREFVHMELLMFLESKPEDSPTFTIFMGERFTMSIALKRYYNEKDYFGMFLDVFPGEAKALLDYMATLVDREVPYNFSDLALQPFKKLLRRSVFMEDVLPDDAGDVKKVFCSQAFTLGLRKCLTHPVNLELKNLLERENSRLMTPSDFFHLVRPFCRRVDMDELRDCRVVFK